MKKFIENLVNGINEKVDDLAARVTTLESNVESMKRDKVDEEEDVTNKNGEEKDGGDKNDEEEGVTNKNDDEKDGGEEKGDEEEGVGEEKGEEEGDEEEDDGEEPLSSMISAKRGREDGEGPSAIPRKIMKTVGNRSSPVVTRRLGKETKK